MNIWPFASLIRRYRAADDERRTRDTEWQRFYDQVNALPLDRAREAALRHIRGDASFYLESASAGLSPHNEAPRALAELWGSYSAITYSGISWVRRDEWQPCPGLAGYYLIGVDLEETLVCCPPSDEIRSYDGEKLVEAYSSIYHWLVSLRTTISDMNRL